MTCVRSLSALAVAALLVAAPAAAQMIKCVDERGVTHYTDQPLPGCKGAEVDIRGQPPISGRLAPGKDDIGRQEREFQRRRIEQGRAEEKAQRQAAQRERRCAALRAQLGRLQGGWRVGTVNDKGERVFLDDAAREQRVAQLRSEIERQCR